MVCGAISRAPVMWMARTGGEAGRSWAPSAAGVNTAQPRAGENRSGPEHSGDCDERDAVKVPCVEPEEPNLGRLDPQAHDGIEVAGIGELGAIALRWLRRRASDASDRSRRPRAPARAPSAALRSDRRGRSGSGSFRSSATLRARTASTISSPPPRNNPQHSAGAVSLRVRHDRVAHRRTHSKFQIHNSKFSTAIAIPMPPPMQSDATP